MKTKNSRRKNSRRSQFTRFDATVSTGKKRRLVKIKMPGKIIAIAVIVLIGFLLVRCSMILFSLASIVTEVTQPSIMDQGRTTIVLDNGQVSIVSLDNTNQTINIFTLPLTVYAVNANQSLTKLAGAFSVAELTKTGTGNKALEAAVAQATGIFIDGSVYSSAIPSQSLVNEVDFRKQFGTFAFLFSILNHGGLVTNASTDLSESDFLRIFWAIHNTRFDKIVATDLTNTNVLLPAQLADGSQVLTISAAGAAATIGAALPDDAIANEGASVTISNASGVTGAGELLARELTSLGAHVVQVDTANTLQTTSTVTVYNQNASKELIKRLSKLSKFTIINAPKSGPQLGDVALTIGEPQSI